MRVRFPPYSLRKKIMSKNYQDRDRKLNKRKHGHRMDNKGLKRILLDLYWKRKRKEKEDEGKKGIQV